MFYNRHLRIFRNAGLVKGFFACTSGIIDRFTITMVFRVFLLYNSRAVSSMGHGTQGVDGSTTTSMYVQGSHGGLIITHTLSFIHVGIRRALIIHLVGVDRSSFHFEVSFGAVDYRDFLDRTGPTV